MTRPITRTRQLYRVWDAAGILLYLGKSVDPLRRLAQHRRDYENGTGAPWWPAFAAGGSWSLDPVIYPDETSVLAAEAAAINAERPLYNDKHNHGNPHRVVVQRGDRRPTVRTMSVPKRRAWPWRRLVTWRRAKVAGGVAAWLAVDVPLSIHTHEMLISAVVTSVVALFVGSKMRPRRRRRRR